MKLRFDLYSGYAGDRRYTEKDSWIQEPGETLEQLAHRICERVLENAEQLTNDWEGTDDENDDA